ncbi:MAG: A/G-specific adenine glycosylase [Pseudomonadota bacterium]
MDFSARLITWHAEHGRHDLPWQGTRDPYAVWLSEIMLQQTQVATVIPYYRRFLARFPDIAALAAATEDEVLQCWSGLGYYSRGRNLHRAARLIVDGHAGIFPSEFEKILSLPGVGRSTAAAISAFAFGQRRAILDGNVKRVLTRYLGIEGYPGGKNVESELWRQAGQLLPETGIEAYTQALMDLGATVCTRTRPACGECPVANGCYARREGRTAELPSSRSRKALPKKETVMLIIMHRGEILLEKRPPAGIWGGLWSFPETEAGADFARVCVERFGVAVEQRKRLPAIDHAFTHFRLRIVPQPLRVTENVHQARQGGFLWLSPEDAGDAAVPAPVRKILLKLMQGDGGSPLPDPPPQAGEGASALSPAGGSELERGPA